MLCMMLRMLSWHACLMTSCTDRSAALTSQHRLYLWGAPLVSLGCLLLIVDDPDWGGRSWRRFLAAYLVGTLVGQATLASAWLAIGPAALIWRIPISLLWITLLFAAAMANGVANDEPGMILLMLSVQWLLTQITLLALIWLLRIEIRHRSNILAPTVRQKTQFGMRQLLIFTAIAGIMFGGARIIAPLMDYHFILIDRQLPVFLLVAAVIVLVPLLLATLLQRNSLAASLSALLFVAGITVLEVPLLKAVGLYGFDFRWLKWFNAFAALWVLSLGALARLLGFRLTVRARRPIRSCESVQAKQIDA